MSDKKVIDVEPTAQAIEEIANTMRMYADELDSVAKNMRTRDDLSYASEAIQAVKNCNGNLRIDLLITRPLRELYR